MSNSISGIDHLEATSDMLQRLQEHVWLVSLSIGWPKMSYQIEGAKVTIETASTDEKVIAEKFRTSPQWALIPERWKTQLQTCEGKARKILSAASVRFGTKGTCLLPITRSKHVFENLRELKSEFDSIADSFTSRYQSILTEMRQEIGEELFASAEKKLPSVNSVREKFTMRWFIIPMAGGGHIPNDYWTDMEAIVDEVAQLMPAGGEAAIAKLQAHLARHTSAAMSTLKDSEMEDLVEEARGQMRQLVSQSIEAMVDEPRQAIIEACENMLAAIRDERTIRTGTIEQIRRAFEYLEGFGFIAGDELLAKIREAATTLGNTTPQQLNGNRQASLALAGALQPVLRAAHDAATAARQVTAFRAVHVRQPPVNSA